jgi:O-antigen/teichoic acid export membrane protein
MTARQGSRSRPSRERGPDSILKNTASSFVAQMVTASLTAVLTLFLVRALGAKQYGLFALTIAISSIAMPFADLGISGSTARFVAEHRGRDAGLRELIADALKLKVVLTGLVCALLAALASVIAGVYGNSELVWPMRAIALATFGQSMYMMFIWVSMALGRAVVNVRLVAAESLLEVSASIALVLAGAGYGQSADVLAALAPYIFFCGLAPLVTNGVNYLGQAGRRVPIGLATLAIIAAGGVILIPRYGVVGAAIATDIAFGFYTLAHIMALPPAAPAAYRDVALVAGVRAHGGRRDGNRARVCRNAASDGLRLARGGRRRARRVHCDADLHA